MISTLIGLSYHLLSDYKNSESIRVSIIEQNESSMTSQIGLAILCLFINVIGAKPSSRIVGGQPTSIRSFSYQVSINKDGKHFCGGSIINEYFVLTSGLCLSIKKPPFEILSGTNNLTQRRNIHQVRKTYIHPDYSRSGWSADIGLIELDRPFNYTKGVYPVTLSSQDRLQPNSRVNASGWGWLSILKPKVSPILQFVEVKTVNTSLCKLLSLGKVTDKNICTYGGPGKGICIGDFGGPLVRSYIQVGIMSWGIPCALGLPDVHTKVSSYLDWIKEVAGKVTTYP